MESIHIIRPLIQLFFPISSSTKNSHSNHNSIRVFIATREREESMSWGFWNPGKVFKELKQEMKMSKCESKEIESKHDVVEV